MHEWETYFFSLFLSKLKKFKVKHLSHPFIHATHTKNNKTSSISSPYLLVVLGVQQTKTQVKFIFFFFTVLILFYHPGGIKYRHEEREK